MNHMKIQDHVAFMDSILVKPADPDQEHIPEIPLFLRVMILHKLFDHPCQTLRTLTRANKVQRTRETRKARKRTKAKRDAGTQMGGHIDWSKYELGKAMQKFRSHKKGLVRNTLRLLHIRWYHA